MTSIYDATSARALATIARKGADVFFPVAGTPPVFDQATNTWSGSTAADPVKGKAVQTENDSEVIATLGLVGKTVVTLLVPAKNLALVPIAGMMLIWAGVTYTIRDPGPLAPDGIPILYTVVAST